LLKIKISAELSHICPLPEISRHAELLEKKGFYRIWIPDTVVSPWEAWLAGSIVAHHTEKIHIGLGVTNPYTRHPVVMAQMACTLQTFCRGRLAVSLGKGIARFLEKAGINQTEKALEECVTIIRHLIKGERFSLRGESFNLNGIRLRTDPPGEKIPLYLAAIGEAGWQRAARVADGVSTIWHDQMEDKRNRFISNPVPVAVLIPFSPHKSDFFPNQVQSPEELEDRIRYLEKADFDEVIIAYGVTEDLECVPGIKNPD
jgi:alkanesulfonate monooxygenase SsuD/methylene tetrahydromethanopterin reductase-like flavin-dependent oxidoreductase (luciferase family)